MLYRQLSMLRNSHAAIRTELAGARRSRRARSALATHHPQAISPPAARASAHASAHNLRRPAGPRVPPPTRPAPAVLTITADARACTPLTHTATHAL